LEKIISFIILIGNPEFPLNRFIMKKIYFFTLLIVITCFDQSCKKNTPDQTPDATGPVLNLELKDVEITVPSNSGYNPIGSKVFSFGTEQIIDATGKSKVRFEKGSATLAYVFNADNKLMLAGFITDSTKVISPATTAKVLLYLGYNIPLQPDTLSVYFLNNIDKLPAAKEWEKEFETLFLADPLILSNKNFVDPLKARMAQMMTQKDPIDIREKASDIQVDAKDIKSGLRVSEDGLSKFKIVNSYRRRAHAFLYKMSFKDMSGSSSVVLNKVEKGTKAGWDKPVDPVSGVTGFLSEVGKAIESKGMESIEMVSGPHTLELKDNESEALYKLRVIGPGGIPKFDLTDTESSTLTRLEIETFLFDLVIPAVGIITSLPSRPKAGVMPDADRNLKSDALLSLVKTMPDVYELIKKAQYKNALKKFMENIYKDATGVLMKELFMIALDRESVTGGVTAFFNEKFERLLAILAMVDAALGASDIIRITNHGLSSAVLEEWEMKAKAGMVTLSPDKSTVITFKQQKISAIVKNLTGTAFYEWSTTGKYGKLSDTKGHTNLISFNSQDKDVFYYSNASNASLSSGDNFEYIYVTAFIGSTKVGTDTAIINVKKDKYQMRPDGVILSGKDGAYNEVNLYLEKADRSSDITTNSLRDYKVIWTTAGKYGKLNGKDITNVTTLTTYNDNEVWYECLDKNTKAAVETVSARIYSKDKSAPESEYKIFDEVEGTVKIDNDDKKRIIHIPVVEFHGDTTYILAAGPGYGCAKFWGAEVPRDPDAKSYTVKFYGAKTSSTGTQTWSWTADKTSSPNPGFWTGPDPAGVYRVVWGGGTWNNRWSLVHITPLNVSGKAEVIIYLK
jgi:hypothetical protein